MNVFGRNDVCIAIQSFKRRLMELFDLHSGLPGLLLGSGLSKVGLAFVSDNLALFATLRLL